MRGPDSRFTRPILLAILAVALLLRLAAARHRSLWLDEFHSLHHARQPSPAVLLEGLRADNHPPASFLLLHGWIRLAGEGQVILRLPSILYALGAAWLASRLARRLAGPIAGCGAALVVALSSLHVLAGAEVRMYALLALAVAGLLEAVGARLAPRKGEREREREREPPLAGGSLDRPGLPHPLLVPVPPLPDRPGPGPLADLETRFS